VDQATSGTADRHSASAASQAHGGQSGEAIADTSVAVTMQAAHHFDERDERYQSITVLRHPVDRVWSMYKFVPYDCYYCENLTQVYDGMDNGNVNPRIDQHCLDQL